MYRGHTVAAVIPAYNESGFVGDVIDGLPAFLDRAYVVDDGSTDDTWAEIDRHAKERNTVHDGQYEDLVVPIRHEANRGVGGAIKTGYQRAREEEIDLTVVLGGDDQMDPGELTRYLDPIVDGVAEYTKGNRFSRPADWAGMPRFRLLGNVVLSYLTKVASGYWATMDSQNGYTAISLSALEATDIDGMYEYYGYCNDLLVRLNAADVRVGDVPRSSEYAYTEGWKSHIDYREYIPRVSVMLGRGFLWRLRRKYLLQRFHPLALFYLLGLGTIASGVAGLVSSLAKRDRDTGSWVLSTVTGVLVVLYATMLDRADNEHLQVRVGSESDSAQDDAAALDPGSDRRSDVSADEGGDLPEEGSPRSAAQADGGLDDHLSEPDERGKP
jgi:glycosyltransferase involved in cell wall biosynthesis